MGPDRRWALKNIESSYPRLFESDAPEIDSRIDRAALTLACIYNYMGEEEKAKNLIDGSLGVLKTGRRHGPGSYDLGYGYAYVENYTLQGRYDDALAELRKWKDDGGRRQWWALKVDLCFKPLWDRPEFIQVMDEIEQEMKQQRQNLREQGIG